ncbi:hypothetical protein [Legionella brunensis]|uniref:Uncharacterized protein n=1 Tax=Legionella brunensis TaxID=29422 RepID=A0A0W0SDA1_9GAMM|nr:hypothetical protein [Legionella brunensis]KTC81487.1 hypothetical protein Lbru_2007 [Legionella brunensis]
MKFKKEDPKTSEILTKNSELLSSLLDNTNGLTRFQDCVKKAQMLKEDVNELALFIDFDETITKIHDFNEYRNIKKAPDYF